MINTIYTILMLLLSAIVIIFGSSTTISIWYALLCLFGLTFTTLLKRTITLYPEVSYKHREIIQTFCVKEFSERFLNNIFALVTHTFLLLMYAHNISLVVAITGVIIYKITVLVTGKNKARNEK